MRIVLPLLFLIGWAISGCGITPEGNVFRAAVQERGAQVMDEGIDNVTWWLCQGASVGSIKREFGASQELADAYATICAQDNSASIVTPE